jgi:hypothetical protein
VTRWRAGRVKVPMLTVVRDHSRALVFGHLSSLATFVLFYLMTTFLLGWGTTALGYTGSSSCSCSWSASCSSR